LSAGRPPLADADLTVAMVWHRNKVICAVGVRAECHVKDCKPPTVSLWLLGHLGGRHPRPDATLAGVAQSLVPFCRALR